jgi:hypothetical protein
MKANFAAVLNENGQYPLERDRLAQEEVCSKELHKIMSFVATAFNVRWANCSRSSQHDLPIIQILREPVLVLHWETSWSEQQATLKRLQKRRRRLTFSQSYSQPAEEIIFISRSPGETTLLSDKTVISALLYDIVGCFFYNTRMALGLGLPIRILAPETLSQEQQKVLHDLIRYLGLLLGLPTKSVILTPQ